VRIFTSLELPDRTRQQISDWLKPVARRYPSLKWVRDDRMHLTLRFFGDIPESRVEEIKKTLSSWHPGNLPFAFDSVGYFGRPGSPSAYWLGGRFSEKVVEIAQKLDRIPDETGRKGGRDFVPHLTIARVRNTSLIPEIDPPETITGQFTQAAIINSRLTSSGPEYTFIDRYDLHLAER
jgi:RNA 2',3'-cyclic 3'-phosphodiesterase